MLPVSVFNYDELASHSGHKVEVVTYAAESAAVECLDCGEVLYEESRQTDFEKRADL